MVWDLAERSRKLNSSVYSFLWGHSSLCPSPPLEAGPNPGLAQAAQDFHLSYGSFQGGSTQLPQHLFHCLSERCLIVVKQPKEGITVYSSSFHFVDLSRSSWVTRIIEMEYLLIWSILCCLPLLVNVFPKQVYPYSVYLKQLKISLCLTLFSLV